MAMHEAVSSSTVTLKFTAPESPSYTPPGTRCARSSAATRCPAVEKIAAVTLHQDAERAGVSGARLRDCHAIAQFHQAIHWTAKGKARLAGGLAATVAGG